MRESINIHVLLACFSKTSTKVANAHKHVMLCIHIFIPWDLPVRNGKETHSVVLLGAYGLK